MFKYLILTVLYSSLVYAITTKDLDYKDVVSSPFVATYKIITAKKSTEVNYYRINNLVAYEYKNQNITEIWKKSVNNQAFLIRAFDKDKRSIEYDPIDIKMENQNNSWKIHKNLADPSLYNLEKSNLVNDNVICKYSHYEKKVSGKSIVMDFDKLNNILLFLEVKKGNELLYSYKLQDIKSINKKQNHITKALSYDTTDFADIGDNESDPFFNKMITLGFVTHKEANIIDVNGNSIELEHKSHKH